MLTTQGCQARRVRLWQSLKSPVDAILLTDPKHLIYFANYWPSPFSFRSNDASAALLLLPDGPCVLIADNLLEPFAVRAHVDEVVLPIWYESRRTAEYRPAHWASHVQAALARHIAANGLVGIDQPSPLLLMGHVGDARCFNVSSVILTLRRSKDPDELELFKLSVRAGEAGMAEARKHAAPGMTERELFWIVERAACEVIQIQAQVYGDFVAGPRTMLGGGLPGDYRLQAGDLVLLDFSVVVWGYRADFAATFVLSNEPTRQQVEMHAACMAAMEDGERLLCAGQPAAQTYEAVQAAFRERRLDRHFPHHAGHGLGLSHPEAPFLVPESEETLQTGDVLTLEPGLYVEGVGGLRIERNYLITSDGFDLLTHHDLKLEQNE